MQEKGKHDMGSRKSKRKSAETGNVVWEKIERRSSGMCHKNTLKSNVKGRTGDSRNQRKTPSGRRKNKGDRKKKSVKGKKVKSAKLLDERFY